MAHTALTRKLEERRMSPEVQAFKTKVIEFLDTVDAPDWMRYKVLCDLSKTVDMPFYGVKKARVACDKTALEIAKEYIDLLIDYGDPDFAGQLLSWTSKQQSQTFRRLHVIPVEQKERHDKKLGGVYEHPVPLKHSMTHLLTCIQNKDKEEAHEYLDFLNEKVPQVFLFPDEDKLVNEHYKYTMPEGWDWRTDTPFIRYEIAGIPPHIYNKRHEKNTGNHILHG